MKELIVEYENATGKPIKLSFKFLETSVSGVHENDSRTGDHEAVWVNLAPLDKGQG